MFCDFQRMKGYHIFLFHVKNNVYFPGNMHMISSPDNSGNLYLEASIWINMVNRQFLVM